jgi:hypothetical protein
LSFYSSYKHKTPKNIFCQYSKLNISGAKEGACGDNFGRNMSHNVPAVYDGLTARIKKCVAFLGLANCGCSEPWEWSVAE